MIAVSVIAEVSVITAAVSLFLALRLLSQDPIEFGILRDVWGHLGVPFRGDDRFDLLNRQVKIARDVLGGRSNDTLNARGVPGAPSIRGVLNWIYGTSTLSH